MGERWLCTVDRPSDRDHLFTGEGEGGEEPFERDGTTRRSRGRKWHVDEIRCARLRGLWTPILGTFRCFGGSVMNSATVPAPSFSGFLVRLFF
ncbi:hypothetical protein CDL15_Pgr027118 [Punica granatum]|uniref:Uncharacterized protein n=1 Tax=Punica granatum TaxID=22663 RepID=A0A218WXR9_PUNGR|nr:hypothetical protein CDL15_Pgr027118 [Punica granatum]